MTEDIDMKIREMKTRVATIKKELSDHKCRIKILSDELEEAKEELKDLNTKKYIS